MQLSPPFWGAGLEQERDLDLRAAEHADQADQQDQLPWITPGEERKYVLYNGYSHFFIFTWEKQK